MDPRGMRGGEERERGRERGREMGMMKGGGEGR